MVSHWAWSTGVAGMKNSTVKNAVLVRAIIPFLLLS
jgi:hypothetical protein